MTTAQKAGAAAALAAILSLGYCAYRSFGPQDDEERPAMIVKNSSITFENEGGQIGWEEDSAGWYPGHARGKPVRHFVAELKNAEAGCTTMEGAHLVITYTFDASKEEFNVFVAGRKPKITPKLLRHDMRTKTLSYGEPRQGQITSVRLRQGGKTCTFPDRTGEIWIRFAYDN